MRLENKFINGHFKPKDLNALKKDLELLRLPAEKKRTLTINVLRRIKTNARDTARGQKSPTGQAWKPRKSKLKTGKMLKKIVSKGSTKANGAGEGKFFFRLKRTAQIAYEHQYGIDQDYIFEDFIKSEKKQFYKTMHDNATLKQARKLKALGFRVPNGKTKTGKRKYRRPSMKEITQLLDIGQAGLIIRKMQETKGGESKKRRWIIPVEKRPFLEERDAENLKIFLDEYEKLNNKK